MSPLLKSEIPGYTRHDGTFVKPHHDKRTRKPKTPASPSPTPRHEVVLFQKTGGQAGSNAGGFYKGADGLHRYVKFYRNDEQAQGEVLANHIYRDLGLGAPDAEVFAHQGRSVYASPLIPHEGTMDEYLNRTHALTFLKGLAADVLTMNWDAAGLVLDNAVVDGAGAVHRIDNGGAFLTRAQGAPKPESLLDEVTEWERFFSPDNPYSHIAREAGITCAEDVPGIDGQIERVLELRRRSGGWGAYVDKTIPDLPAPRRARIAQMLEARTDFLQSRLSPARRKAHEEHASSKAGPSSLRKGVVAPHYRTHPGDGWPVEVKSHQRLDSPAKRQAMRREQLKDVGAHLRTVGAKHMDSFKSGHAFVHSFHHPKPEAAAVQVAAKLGESGHGVTRGNLADQTPTLTVDDKAHPRVKHVVLLHQTPTSGRSSNKSSNAKKKTPLRGPKE